MRTALGGQTQAATLALEELDSGYAYVNESLYRQTRRHPEHRCWSLEALRQITCNVLAIEIRDRPQHGSTMMHTTLTWLRVIIGNTLRVCAAAPACQACQG